MPRCGTKSVLDLVFRQLKRKFTNTTTTDRGGSLGEFLHSASNTKNAYKVGSIRPTLANQIKGRSALRNSPDNQFFDYEYIPSRNIIKWKSTSVRKKYNSSYLSSLIDILEHTDKPWVIKTFPGALINNKKNFDITETDVIDALYRLEKISTPIILKRDFKEWIVSLYLSTTYEKFYRSEVTTEFLDSINKPHTMPSKFITRSLNHYKAFYKTIELIYPNVQRFTVKEVFNNTDEFLTNLNLPLVSLNPIEYSKLDYRKIITNYDDIEYH